MHENKQLPPVAQVAPDDQWLDEALSQTFPASDPVPWRYRETATSFALSRSAESAGNRDIPASSPTCAQTHSQGAPIRARRQALGLSPAILRNSLVRCA